MTFRQRLARHLRWYGSRQGILDAAHQGDPEAEAAVLDLQILDEAPEQIDVMTRFSETIVLDDEEITLLTPTRWRLLEAVGHNEGITLAELGRRLGRDKKNISDDVRILQKMGLVTAHKQGRVKRVWLRGQELRLVLPGQDPVDPPDPDPVDPPDADRGQASAS